METLGMGVGSTPIPLAPTDLAAWLEKVYLWRTEQKIATHIAQSTQRLIL